MIGLAGGRSPSDRARAGDHLSWQAGRMFVLGRPPVAALDRAGLTVHPAAAELAAGTTVLVVLRLPLITAIAACRIVYVVDEPDIFGFGYGTLPAHPEQGEEAFVVRRASSGEIRFEVTAFSRPRHPLARLGGPMTRMVQRQTTGRYLHALKAACG